MQDHTSGGTFEQRRSVLTTLALGLSTFLILFDVTAVVVAMPAIAKDVGLGVAGLAAVARLCRTTSQDGQCWLSGVQS